MFNLGQPEFSLVRIEVQLMRSGLPNERLVWLRRLSAAIERDQDQ